LTDDERVRRELFGSRRFFIVKMGFCPKIFALKAEKNEIQQYFAIN
jgi:hypothetical protein